VAPLTPIGSSLLEARGCVLAEDVTAPGDIPPFANSAMDGFAVRAARSAAAAACGWSGEIAAGASDLPRPARASRADHDRRADARRRGRRVPVELTEEDARGHAGRADADPGDNVREAGESVRAGEVVLRAGRVLGPPRSACSPPWASAGWPHHPKVRVATLRDGGRAGRAGHAAAARADL
jgi:molybdopterin molybdotransferase